MAAYQYIAITYIAELLLGWTEDAEADVPDLLEAGRRAVTLSPADSLSQGMYGNALAIAGDHDEALSCLRRALALNANSVNVLGPCSLLLSASGDPRGANDMIERMLRLAPAHYFRSGFLSQMALNCYRIGELERGLSLVSEALKLKPDAPCCHIVHAEILRATGRPDAAKTSIAKAYKVRPDLNEALSDFSVAIDPFRIALYLPGIGLTRLAIQMTRRLTPNKATISPTI